MKKIICMMLMAAVLALIPANMNNARAEETDGLVIVKYVLVGGVIIATLGVIAWMVDESGKTPAKYSTKRAVPKSEVDRLLAAAFVPTGEKQVAQAAATSTDVSAAKSVTIMPDVALSPATKAATVGLVGVF